MNIHCVNMHMTLTLFVIMHLRNKTPPEIYVNKTITVIRIVFSSCEVIYFREPLRLINSIEFVYIPSESSLK